MVKDFLPISREDMKKRGWQQLVLLFLQLYAVHLEDTT